MKIILIILTAFAVSLTSYFMAQNDQIHSETTTIQLPENKKTPIDTSSKAVVPSIPHKTIKHHIDKHNKDDINTDMATRTHSFFQDPKQLELKHLEIKQNINRNYKALFRELRPSSTESLREILFNHKLESFNAMLANKAIHIQRQSELKESLISEQLPEDDYQKYLLFERMKHNLK